VLVFIVLNVKNKTPMIPKIKRTLTVLLPVDSNRAGECNGCGDCCKLPFRCLFLRDTPDGKAHCAIYKVRPPNCRKFPRNKAQWQSVKQNCGFVFPDIKVEPNITDVDGQRSV
jgi:Fe-S-cluster containining protein